MNGYDVKRLALILAVQAQIEGMKAENVERESLGHSVAYGDADFCCKSDELINIVNTNDDQL